jgi:acyl carrier protein
MTTNSPDLTTLMVWLIERVAHYLERSTAFVDPSVPLAETGIDSVSALNLCGDIEDTWGVEVDPTLAYDYPRAPAKSCVGCCDLRRWCATRRGMRAAARAWSSR